MKDKKLIERKLSFGNEYVYNGMTQGSIIDGVFCTCDNCGKIISRMASITDTTTEKNHTIGMDCLKTIQKATQLFNNGSNDYEMDVYELGIINRFATAAAKDMDSVIYSGMYFRVTSVSKKGKETNHEAFPQTLLRFNINLYNKLVHLTIY